MKYKLIVFLAFFTVFAVATTEIQKGVTSMANNTVTIQDVPLWGCFETAVTNTKHYDNPFTDVVLNATFTRPDGSEVSFLGFYDGDGNGGQSGNIWKLRFMPDQIGTWKYVCSFSDGTPGKSGTFNCISDNAKPGPLRIDPDNHHYWIFADGTHFPVNAYTAPELFIAGNVKHRKYWIDYFFGKKHKFNLCNANLLNFVGVNDVLNWQGTPYKAPNPDHDGEYVTISGNGLFPYLFSGTHPLFDGGSNVDWLRPNIKCWTNADQVIRELENHEVVWFNHWSMIGWEWGGNGRLLVPKEVRKSVLQYWIARLAPYWNVTWNIAGEWEELMTQEELNELGNFIKQKDPWAHPITSHSLNTTTNAPWVDFRTQQFSAGTSANAIINAKHAIDDYADKPVFAFETSWEATPGKLTADQVRTGAWGSVMGGAFYLYAECFEPTLTWGDGDAFSFVEIMNDFIYGLQYWKLQPNNALVDSESLCLANIEQEYVIYCQNGGVITVDLTGASDAYVAEWMNPRTGQKTPIGTANGESKRTFTCPDRNDWVLHLSLSEK